MFTGTQQKSDPNEAPEAAGIMTARQMCWEQMETRVKKHFLIRQKKNPFATVALLAVHLCVSVRIHGA